MARIRIKIRSIDGILKFVTRNRETKSLEKPEKSHHAESFFALSLSTTNRVHTLDILTIIVSRRGNSKIIDCGISFCVSRFILHTYTDAPITDSVGSMIDYKCQKGNEIRRGNLPRISSVIYVGTLTFKEEEKRTKRWYRSQTSWTRSS